MTAPPVQGRQHPGPASPPAWQLLVLLLLPLGLLLLNPNWIYSFAGHIDPWVYHGLFRNGAYLTRVFPDTYYASRLPWVLPGQLMYHLFPPDWANRALHFLFYDLTVFSIYFAIRAVSD